MNGQRLLLRGEPRINGITRTDMNVTAAVRGKHYGVVGEWIGWIIEIKDAGLIALLTALH